MRVDSYQQYKGEAFTYTVDWSVKVGKLNTAVSSVTWSVDSGSATITSEALSSNIASALVTTGSEGCSLIKLVAALADGQTDIHFFKVNAKDPSCVQSSSGRY